jgi:nitroreductase
MNRQPWKLIVVSDRAALAQIDQTGMDNLKEIDEAGHSRVQGRGGRLLYNAPAMIIIAIDSTPAPYPASMDAGIVAAHLALAATSLGLDTCIAAMPRMAFRADSADSLAATYLPEGFEFAVSVLIGYAVTSGGAQHEPDFTKITYL